MADEEKYEYSYPIEEIDRMIDMINRGVTPMMSSQMELELKVRYKQLKKEALGDDDDDIDDSDIVMHREMMKRHIEKKKREATKDDVILIKLSESQQKQLEEDMSVSIVRPNPNLSYHKPDDALFQSAERKAIYQKLARLKHCYYNATDYTNAIKIIKDAIEYSLRNDYPWMSYEEALAAYNAGEIKLLLKLPKLYLNYQTQVTDVEILKGIVTGEITIKDRNEKPDKRVLSKDYNPVSVEYNVIGQNQFNSLLTYHNQGYDTPISASVRAKSTIYNRFALPNSNMFSLNGGTQKSSNEPVLFDWMKEGAGKRYFKMINGREDTVGDFIRSINNDNDNLLNNVLNSNAVEFMRSLKYAADQNQGYERPAIISTSLQVNPEAAQFEQNVLNAIRATNPNK